MIKTQFRQSNKEKTIVFVTLFVIWGLMTFVPIVFQNKTGRLLADPIDRSVYFERGRWILQHSPLITEYPQIPTLLFGINIIPFRKLPGELQLNAYMASFSLEMILILFLVYKTLLELLPSRFRNYSLLVFLPATLYFTYNRFDILPAYLCLIAYVVAIRRQWITAAVLLALATFTKWYPILLFPAFFAYASALESRFQWKMVIAFGMTGVTILALAYFFWGGWEAIVGPYQFHLARGMEFIALPVLLNRALSRLVGAQIGTPFLFVGCFLLQICTPLIVFFRRINSPEALVEYCVLAIGMFVLFSRIWSPQWLLWLFPFLVISAQSVKKILLLVLYNGMTYLCFPILFFAFGPSSIQLKIAGLLTFLILFAIIIESLMNFWQTAARTTQIQNHA